MHLYITASLSSTFVILFFGNGLHLINSAKILGIFPDPAISHFNFNKQIMYSLFEAGHQITFVSQFQEPNPSTSFTFIVPERTNETNSKFGTNREGLPRMQHMLMIRPKQFQFCLDVMEIPEIQNSLKSGIKMYDILIMELTLTYYCLLPLAEKLNIPVIGTVALRQWVNVGDVFGDTHPSAVPSPFLPIKKKMSFFERFRSAIENLHLRLILMYTWRATLTNFFPEYSQDFSPQSHHSISVLFSNSHASLYSTPLIPKVVEVAGIILNPIKPLPETLEKFLNASENGVILLSFGTIIKSNKVDARLRNVFRETFRCLNQRIIWKFDENIENISENVLISDWIPQRDILAHKNVKLFISHAGLNGMYEAIDAGVPSVCIPFVIDQIANSGLIEDIGAGMRLDRNTVTAEILLNAIYDVLNDEKYYQRMKKLSAEFRDRPMSPQESVVYWTEYVLRHNGTQHLQTVSAELPLYQYLLIDVIIFTIIIVLTFLFIIKLISKISRMKIRVKLQ